MSNSFYCNRCGCVNLYGQGQCPSCGQPFYYNCPQCGAYVNNTCPSCPSCGMQLLWPGQQAAPEQQNYWEQQHTHQYAQGQQYVDQTNREIQYTEYEGVEGSRGMNPILRGVLVIVAVVAVGAGGFWAYNTVFKHTAGSTAAQSTGASQPAQNAGNTVQPSSPAQPAASPPQPASAPSQSPASPASPPAQSQQAPQTPPPASPPTYTPPDNGFNGGQTTPPDNAFSSGGNRTPPDNTY